MSLRRLFLPVTLQETLSCFAHVARGPKRDRLADTIIHDPAAMLAPHRTLRILRLMPHSANLSRLAKKTHYWLAA